MSVPTTEPAKLAVPTAAARSSFRAGLGSFYAADAVHLVGWLAVTPLLLRYLGEARYGVYALAGSIVGYLGLLNLGVKPALTRFVAASEAKGDRSRTEALVSTTAVLFAALGAFGLIVALAVAQRIEAWFDIPAAVAPACATFVAVKGVQLALALPLGAWESTTYGLGRVPTMNAIRATQTLLELGACALVVGFAWDLATLAWLGVGATVLTGALSVRALASVLPDLRIRVSAATAGVLGELVRYGALFAIDSLVVLLVFKTDEIVIAGALGIGAVAVYAAVNQAVQGLLGVVLRIGATIYPDLSALAAKGDQERLRVVFARATDGALWVAAGLSMLVVVFGPALVKAWLPLGGIPVWAIRVLGLVIVAHAPISVASKVLAASGSLRRVLVVSLVEGVGNLTLSLMLVGPLGLTGIALGTLAAQTLTTTWFNPRAACRELGLSFSRFALGRLGRLALVVAPGGLVAALLLRLTPEPSVAVLAGEVVTCAAIHAVVCGIAWRRVSRS